MIIIEDLGRVLQFYYKFIEWFRTSFNSNYYFNMFIKKLKLSKLEQQI